MKRIIALLALVVFPVLAYAQVSVNITTSNVTCNSICDGTATASATGGTPPYTYTWSPVFGNTPGIMNLCPGTYTCTVTDQLGGTQTQTCVITQPPVLNITATSTSPTTCSACDGVINVSATGGVGAYTYQYTPTYTAGTACTGGYTVAVTDANGCQDYTSVVVYPPVTLTVTLTANPMTPVCAGSSVAFTPSVSGGTGPYTFNWIFPGGSPSSSTMQNPVVTYNTPGTHLAQLSVMDANGCSNGIASFNVTVLANPTITVSQIPSSCNQSTGTFTGSGAVTYGWQPGNLAGSPITNQPGGITYTVIGTDANGCSSSLVFISEDSCDYVWPGDANDDAVADNIDILDIGIANGATGTTRANATTTWIGQPSTPWGQTLLSGTDYKWVDCDGNGIINLIDTQAVTLNYGFTHNNRYAAPSNSAVAPDLRISFDQDSLTAGQSGSLTLSLGDASTPANNIYGVAFRLNYDAAQLATPTFGMMGGTTWIGTPGTDLMRVVLHPNAAMGFVDVAITRYDQQNVSGNGNIAQMYFTTTTALTGTGSTSDVAATVTNVVLIDNTGASQVVNVINDNVVVADTGIILSVVPAASTEISVYPNPASDNINITIPAGDQQLVTIEDAAGRIVYSAYHNPGINTVSVASLQAGLYILRVAGSSSIAQPLVISAK